MQSAALALVVAVTSAAAATLVADTYDPHAMRVFERRRSRRVSHYYTIRWEWAVAFFVGCIGVFVVAILLGLVAKLLNPPRREARHYLVQPAPSAPGPSQPNAAGYDAQRMNAPQPTLAYSDNPQMVLQPRIQEPAATYTYDDTDRDQRYLFARGNNGYTPMYKSLSKGNASSYDLVRSSPSSEESPFEVYESQAYSPTGYPLMPTSVAQSRPQRASRGPLPQPPQHSRSARRSRNELQGPTYSAHGASRPVRASSQRSANSQLSRGSSQLSRVDSIGAGSYRRNSRSDRRRSQMTTAERLAALRSAVNGAEHNAYRESYGSSTMDNVLSAYTDYGNPYRSNYYYYPTYSRT